MLAHTAARLPFPPSAVAAGAIAGSAMAGTAMAYSLKLGVAVALALCFAPLVLLNLRLGLVLWIPSTSLIAVSALGVAPSLAGLLIVFTWLGAVAMGYSNVTLALLRNQRLHWLVGALVFWVVLSIAWVQPSPPSRGVVVNWLVAGAIMLVMPTVLTDRRHLLLATAAIVIGAVASIGIGLQANAIQTTSDRLVGGSGDPNFLAAGCVPAIVLAMGLGAGIQRAAARWAAVGAVAFVTIGLIASESRGGLVAAIVAAVASVVLMRHVRAWVIGFLLCIVGVAVAFYSVNPAAWERMSNFKESNGRDELWRAAWHMWQDHPFVGVGLHGFFGNLGDYARELGPLKYASFIAEQPHYVHNSFLELLVENGVVGLLLYLAVVAACVRCAWRAGQRFEHLGDAAMAILSRAVIISVLAMLSSAFFISGATDRRLWVLLALGPALLIATRGAADGGRSKAGADNGRHHPGPHPQRLYRRPPSERRGTAAVRTFGRHAG